MRENQLKDLIQSGQSHFEILANEGIIYLVRVVWGEQRALLKDDKGENMRFRSATAAGTFLAGLGAEKAVVVHQCAYDEVIGHEPIRGNGDLRTPMDLSGLKPFA